MAIESGRGLLYPEDQLSARQLYAVEYVKERAKIASAAAMPNLLAKFTKLGYTSDDLDETLDYIRFHAPMIIHFSGHNSRLLKDSHYRNREEVYKCKNRRTAELTMFGPGSYTKDVPAFELVKYGVLNAVNEPK
ncbi:hypothetical protein HDV00_003762 [Rhizophlyctis rosea]|nr:hypothetical protein HDV00_003762 [Rhizophlyctis rosea]